MDRYDAQGNPITPTVLAHCWMEWSHPKFGFQKSTFVMRCKRDADYDAACWRRAAALANDDGGSKLLRCHVVRHGALIDRLRGTPYLSAPLSSELRTIPLTFA
jgi:hypothetical protein